MKTRIHFFTDSPSSRPFAGSCAAVSYEIERCSKAFGFAFKEEHFSLLIPPSERKAIKLEPSDLKQEEVRVIFEEIYPRIIQNTEFSSAKNIVLFNLYCFGQSFRQYGNANRLVFNSNTLLDLFVAKLISFDESEPKFVEGFSSTDLSVLELFSPTIVFKGGYDSVGEGLSPDLQKLAKKKNVLIGHGMRPYKANPVETGLILLELSELAKRDGKMICYVLPEENCLQLLQVIEQNFGQGKMDLLRGILFPSPRLSNRALNSLMRMSKFSLGYDNVIEAFGFYPLESVSNGCPFFTNGIGNLKNLLCARDGIFVDYPIELYSKANGVSKRAYRRLGARIYSKILQKNNCHGARKEILKRYSKSAFEKRFKKVVRFGKVQPNTIRIIFETGYFCLNPLVLGFSGKRMLLYGFPELVSLTNAQLGVLRKVLGRRSSVYRKLKASEKRIFSLLWKLGILTVHTRKGEL